MSWIKYAKPGDKVVCVNAEWEIVLDHGPGPDPEPNQVYTIEIIEEFASDIFLFLRELGGGYGFSYDGFRPVPKRDTDISIFTEMLNKAPAKTLEEV